MNSRSVPAAAVISRGSKNLTLGNASSIRYGGGGSGEPLIFDVVHGTRFLGTAAVFGLGLSASPTVGDCTIHRARAPTSTGRVSFARCMMHVPGRGENRVC